MDEQPFVEATRAAPGDVTQRLIYADWLEEHGDSDIGPFLSPLRGFHWHSVGNHRLTPTATC